MRLSNCCSFYYRARLSRHPFVRLTATEKEFLQTDLLRGWGGFFVQSEAIHPCHTHIRNFPKMADNS